MFHTTTFFLWSKMFSPVDTEASTIVPVVYLYDTVFGGKGKMRTGMPEPVLR